MLGLREYRGRADRLSDHLPWAALVAPGVVLNKDGGFQRSAEFRGPDLDSATDSEVAAIAARLNGALRRLGSGWAIFVEARRDPAAAYPASVFPDPVSALVEEERRAEQLRQPGRDKHRNDQQQMQLGRIGMLECLRQRRGHDRCAHMRMRGGRFHLRSLGLIGSSRTRRHRLRH